MGIWWLSFFSARAKASVINLTFPVISLIERSLTIPLAQSPILS
ncbi:hypothetical protein COO91_11121 (plasmid) [Nostoc flagelliforme CCNUN1]|uniref:Uncharacterized protein n=1 Tax=Nostoc flagelliforme CCNUN1 TaxID=2038116 RepID=A0A2K8T3R9_9NOSO|nr:hypothetical protein COO91_00096 [Nostoc flagelliforme CCNUN1]AUB35307.1 hypothetical protein COO91_01183 [Nostoc flagelliforme CCNUN1]AUB35612.1 hypothetical protein COO91_01502 [Nostoc flagelliforme CCNUN1]AUB37511.1 hypothetical protein COO91_03456 [Nostoc flagelliforme CCNUN1]AUB42045.1 hypothetical protein COO91_08144 [Nostoc flagelliforme CCNUN1]